MLLSKSTPSRTRWSSFLSLVLMYQIGTTLFRRTDNHSVPLMVAVMGLSLVVFVVLYQVFVASGTGDVMDTDGADPDQLPIKMRTRGSLGTTTSTSKTNDRDKWRHQYQGTIVELSNTNGLILAHESHSAVLLPEDYCVAFRSKGTNEQMRQLGIGDTVAFLLDDKKMAYDIILVKKFEKREGKKPSYEQAMLKLQNVTTRQAPIEYQVNLIEYYSKEILLKK